MKLIDLILGIFGKKIISRKVFRPRNAPYNYGTWGGFGRRKF